MMPEPASAEPPMRRALGPQASSERRVFRIRRRVRSGVPPDVLPTCVSEVTESVRPIEPLALSSRPIGPASAVLKTDLALVRAVVESDDKAVVPGVDDRPVVFEHRIAQDRSLRSRSTERSMPEPPSPVSPASMSTCSRLTTSSSPERNSDSSPDLDLLPSPRRR